MHILLFASLYPNPKSPHMGVFVEQQVRALARQHQVTVIAPYMVRPAELVRRESGHAKPSDPAKAWTLYQPRYLYLPGLWWIFYLFSSLLCARKVHWPSVDMVHAHVAIPGGFAAALLSRRHGKPFVLTEHTSRFSQLMASRTRRAAVTWTIQQAQRVIVVSSALQKSIEQAGLDARFTVIPNTVDPEEFYPTGERTWSGSGPLRLLWVGSFHPTHFENKGVIDLLQALALARTELGVNAHLTLLGDGSAQASCRELAQQLGVSKACTFAGAVAHASMPGWLNQSHALVVSSRKESFGVVLIEAMACGKPVVSTRCGGPEEIVTPETGILVKAGDPRALAEGLARLVKEYDSFDPLGIAEYAHTRYRPERVAQMLLGVYNEVRGNTAATGKA